MSKKQPKGDYEVGYCKPPKAGQIKKDEVRNPWGCRGKNASGLLEITSTLEKPIVVRVGNRTKKMSVFEANARSLINQALKDKKIMAVIEFLDLCDEYDLLAQPEGGVRRLVVPKDYDGRKWLEMLNTYGPPPWPGEHNGLPKSNPRQIVKEPTTPKHLPNPLHKRQRANKKKPGEILYEIATQKHWVMEDGKRKRRSVLEMVLVVLRGKVAEGNRRARRFHDRLCAKYGAQEITYGGVLGFEEITTEEWMERYGRPKPDSAA